MENLHITNFSIKIRLLKVSNLSHQNTLAQRYEKSSTIITSNRDFNEWPSIFVNPLLGTAALDRLVHKGIQVIIEGPSYRLAEFKKTCTKAKKASQSSCQEATI